MSLLGSFGCLVMDLVSAKIAMSLSSCSPEQSSSFRCMSLTLMRFWSMSVVSKSISMGVHATPAVAVA